MSTLSLSPSKFVFVVLLVLAAFAWNCKGPGDFKKNELPITRLANVPPPDTLITSASPLLTLWWVGDDPDGFVVAFRYRWSYRTDASSPYQYKPWTTVLNLWNVVGGGPSGTQTFALMTNADVSSLPNVYHYFAILPVGGLAEDSVLNLARGDSLYIAGARVWASNTRAELHPVNPTPSKGVFIFDSPDTLNYHTFEVLSVDNVAAEGVPASVSFFSPRVAAPKTRITEWPQDTVMVLMDRTVTFGGVPFAYQGFDPNSRTIDYQWVVDRDLWPAGNVPWSDFTKSQAVTVTARDFPDPYATEHTFYVRSRNEFGVIDTLGMFVEPRADGSGIDTIRAHVSFKTIYPLFARPGNEKRILVLTNSYSWPDGTPARPTVPMIDQYYTTMLNNIGRAGAYDFYDVTLLPDKSKPYPGRGFLAKYSAVILVCDAINYGDTWGYDQKGGSGFPGEIKSKLIDYLNVGGRLVVSSWALPWGINAGVGDGFMSQVCHLQDINRAVDDSSSHVGFGGATGLKEYPSVVFDSTKADTLWSPVHFIFAGRPYGFGEKIYLYNPVGNGFTPLAGQTVATRYLGLTFDVIYFGFPLYYVEVPGVSEQPSATALLRQALIDINQ
jgi:hypothetical protein